MENLEMFLQGEKARLESIQQKMAEELREAERPALTRLAGPYEDFFYV